MLTPNSERRYALPRYCASHAPEGGLSMDNEDPGVHSIGMSDRVQLGIKA